MAVVPEYEYQDLLHTDSIRILQLQPSKTHHGDLHIELIEVKLGEFLEYEAISYVWGEPITRNLDTALRGLRSENVVRNLWTDAVCINQMSMDEKAQQIPLMGGIYKFANCVLAWLG
ncbi:heterokaryon incompatibility protein-domain-containing protein, partial [Leptodontidium sp. 2 PMI_412]